ncbi:VIT1/CCC1 transporter family protein [Rhodobacteraceae bacterium D3-12]|nr:VIT1/CCC1 transporter family protein [Rhodobacteraceae bacterium D3-12]
MDWQAHRRDAHSLGRTQEFLKQITYGGNDGIVTTFAIVAGFVGAASDGIAQIGALAVLVFGVANLLADAVSMGLGEYLSTRSAHDLYHARRSREMHEIEVNPEQERLELRTILHQRGLSDADAEATTEILSRNPDMMADLMMTYEFGMMDPAEDNPVVNGFATFLSFVVFGAVPLVPYFLLEPTAQTFNLSLAASGAALLALGLLRWNATGEHIARCVGETMAVGSVCGAVAYLVGWVIGG